MISLNANIPVVFNVNSLRKYEVVRVRENGKNLRIFVSVQVYGPNVGGDLNRFGDPITVSASQSGLCQVLSANPSPSRFDDQLQVVESRLPGAYAAIAAALDSVAGRSAQRKAVEDVLVASGLLSAEFVGT